MPLETSAEHPVPVRRVSQLLAQWIGRLGHVWIEGQVAQLSRRPGQRTAFLTLRDPCADMSLTVTCSVALLDGPAAGVVEGATVVVHDGSIVACPTRTSSSSDPLACDMTAT